MTSPTGEQYQISHGDQVAVVTEQGATLRSYRVGDHELLASFEAEQSPQGCQGQHLLPWPNRIRDGRYRFDGIEQQLPITEHERHNAIHGLAAWLSWQLVEHGPDRVSQSVLLLPQPGWPGACRCTITHRLDDQGLVVEVSASNVGEVAFPFGYAAHPYLRLDQATSSQWTLGLPFGQRLEVDDRLLPVRLSPVEAEFDLRRPRPLGQLDLDTAFTAPEVSDGRWTVTLGHGEQVTELWGEAPLDWLQVYTPGDRGSIAIEPMTVGPDAFNPGPTHADLAVLQPGDQTSLRWGLRSR